MSSRSFKIGFMIKLYYTFYNQYRNFTKKFKIIASIFSIISILFWVFAFKSSILDANNIPTGSMIPTLKIGDFLFVNQMRYTLRIPFTDYVLWKIDRPQRGDIVTFVPPQEDDLKGKILVKRLIGVPGDTIRVEDDEIYVNELKYPVSLQKDKTIALDSDYPAIDSGQSMDDYDLYKESIINPNTKEMIMEHYIMKLKYNPLFGFNELRNPNKTWVLSDNSYMVMGDNRDNSNDSRNWGLLTEDQIKGKVFMAYFSLNKGEKYSHESFEAGNMLTKNPIVDLIGLLTGKYPHANIRWDRVGLRIY